MKWANTLQILVANDPFYAPVIDTFQYHPKYLLEITFLKFLKGQ